MTRVLVLATVLLVTSGLLAGCGDDGTARADDHAGGADFCTTYVEQVRRMATLDQEDVDAGIASAKDWADRMRDVQLPDDVPERARRGLDVMVQEFEDLDADATWQDVQRLGDDLDRKARRDLAATGDYVQTACADQVDEVMADLVDDLDGLQEELDGNAP